MSQILVVSQNPLSTYLVVNQPHKHVTRDFCMTEIKHKIKKKQKYNLFFHLYHYDPEPGCPNGHGCHQHPLLLSPFLHPPTPQTTPPIPDQLLYQLHTIRATINHLTRLQNTNNPTKKSIIPSDSITWTNKTQQKMKSFGFRYGTISFIVPLTVTKSLLLSGSQIERQG